MVPGPWLSTEPRIPAAGGGGASGRGASGGGASGGGDAVDLPEDDPSAAPLPDDQLSREKIIDGLDEKVQETLESLDQEFFAYPDNLTELLFEYVHSNPQVFGDVPAE